MSSADLPWWLLQVLWLGTELFLMLALVAAAVVQRRHLVSAVGLGLGAVCCGWFAVHAVASWVLFDVGPIGVPEAVMVSDWVLQPLSRVAGLALWVALAAAVFAPRTPPVEPSADPFAE